MSIRKIKDIEPTHYCNNPEHNPPSYMVFQPGVYEYKCPQCGKKQQFTVYPSGLT